MWAVGRSVGRSIQYVISSISHSPDSDFVYDWVRLPRLAGWSAKDQLSPRKRAVGRGADAETRHIIPYHIYDSHTWNARFHVFTALGEVF